jgi:hypothetical protein
MGYEAESAIRILQGRLQSDRPYLFVGAEVIVRQLMVNLNFHIVMPPRCILSWPGRCSAREGTLKQRKLSPNLRN